MARRGENIYKRKDGRYEGRYKVGEKDDGGVKYGYVYSYRYSEVKRKLGEHKVARIQRDIASCDMTVTELTERWLASARIRVKESTYARYVSLLKRHILPEFAAVKAGRVTTERLNVFVSAKLGTGLSAATVRGIMGIFGAVLDYGEKEYGLQNPTLRVSLPKHTQKEIRVLSTDEWERLSIYTSHGRDYSKLGVLLSLYTGIRIGEACALKVSNVRFDKGVLRIESTMQRISNTGEAESRTRIITSPPKSESSVREIPLPKFLLDKLKAAYANVPGDAYLLTGSAEKYIEPRVYQNRFKGYLRDCGIADINFHALRHSFATYCVDSGGDLKALSEILGHSNISVTLSKYIHPSVEQKRHQMELLAAVSH